MKNSFKLFMEFFYNLLTLLTQRNCRIHCVVGNSKNNISVDNSKNEFWNKWLEWYFCITLPFIAYNIMHLFKCFDGIYLLVLFGTTFSWNHFCSLFHACVSFTISLNSVSIVHCLSKDITSGYLEILLFRHNIIQIFYSSPWITSVIHFQHWC